jgi:hypothetical protein
MHLNPGRRHSEPRAEPMVLTVVPYPAQQLRRCILMGGWDCHFKTLPPLQGSYTPCIQGPSVKSRAPGRSGKLNFEGCPQFVLHNWLKLLYSLIFYLASHLPILLSSHLLKRSLWSMLHLVPDVQSSTSTETKKLVQYRLQHLDNSWGTNHQKRVTTCQGIVCTLHYFFLMTLSKPCSMQHEPSTFRYISNLVEFVENLHTYRRA